MIKFLGKKKKEERHIGIELLDTNNIPRHVAIIMDGNGRWLNGGACRAATATGLARTR